MLVAGALGGLGLAGTHTGAYALALDRVPDNQRGGATAVFQYAWDLGGLGGGAILGILASTISVSAVFWASAAIATGGFALLLYGRSVGWTQPLAPGPVHLEEPSLASDASVAGPAGEANR